jgi:hypothetical protein
VQIMMDRLMLRVAGFRRIWCARRYRALDAHASTMFRRRRRRSSKRSIRCAARRATTIVLVAPRRSRRGVDRIESGRVDAEHRSLPKHGAAMVAIGEEAGSLDSMLSKVADFYESRG